MVDSKTPSEALQAAVRAAGSKSAFARLIGVTPGAIWQMLRDNRRLAAEHVLTVERETGISRHDLRPDLYPRDPAPAATLEPAR